MTAEERLIEALKAYAEAHEDSAPSFEAVVFADCEAKKAIAELCLNLKLNTRIVLKGLNFQYDNHID